MSDLHLFYDILKDAFEGGIAYGQDTEVRGKTAADILFPLAARMEEEIRKLSAWQPIETAPKDHSEILLFARGDRDYMGAGQWSTGGYLKGTVDGWFWAYAIRPTHWMSLPSAPERET